LVEQRNIEGGLRILIKGFHVEGKLSKCLLGIEWENSLEIERRRGNEKFRVQRGIEEFVEVGKIVLARTIGKERLVDVKGFECGRKVVEVNVDR
jgi:hypothetical protein